MKFNIEVDDVELGLVNEDGECCDTLTNMIIDRAANKLQNQIAWDVSGSIHRDMLFKAIDLIEKEIPNIRDDIISTCVRKRKLAELCASDKENKAYIEWVIEEVMKRKMKSYITETVEEVLKKKLGLGG